MIVEDGEAAHTRAVYDETLEALSQFPGGQGSQAFYMRLLSEETTSTAALPSAPEPDPAINVRGREIRPTERRAASTDRPTRPAPSELCPPDPESENFIERITGGITNEP